MCAGLPSAHFPIPLSFCLFVHCWGRGRFFKLPSRFQFLRSSLASFLNSTKAVLNEALGKGPFFTEVDTGTILGTGKHGKTSLLSLVIY